MRAPGLTGMVQRLITIPSWAMRLVTDIRGEAVRQVKSISVVSAMDTGSIG
jgi:hypothetical protein